ncbi:MAG: hypothetical protein QM503_15690 [Bacteroidota bacterium]
MQAGLSTKNAPSPNVILPYYAFGAVSFLVASIVLFIAAPDLTRHYMSPKLFTLTHILILGWITMIIFGALYQLIPVVMEVKLYSEKLAVISFFLFAAGLITLSVSFWTFAFGRSIGLEVGGYLIVTAVILFAINTLKSAAKSDRKNIENTFIITAVIWLILTVTLGIIMALNFAFHFISESHLQLLKLHAHIGFVGWFLMLVVGVASKLMPMFLIVHKLPLKLLKYAYFLINGGLILLSVGYYYFPEKWFMLISSLLIVLGIVAFLRFNYVAFSKRIRRKLDVGMKLSASAFIMLAITIILGLILVISPDFLGTFITRIQIAYGVLIVLGFLTALVLGQTYKTLPFIIWLQKYQSKVGKSKVPLPHELYSEKVANYHFYTFITSIIILIAGILLASVLIIKIGAAIMILTAALYNYNVFKIVLHKEKK